MTSESELIGPGVFEAPWLLPDGSRPVLAIDADGVVRGRYYLQPEDDANLAASFLETQISDSGERSPRTPENSNLELIE